MRKSFLCRMLVVVLILSVSLAGCKKENNIAYEPQNAVELWKKIDETMDGVRSVKTDIIMDMVYRHQIKYRMKEI